MNKFSIEYEQSMIKKCEACKDVQIQQLKNTIKNGLTYQTLKIILGNLVRSGLLSKSQANKYKSWYRNINKCRV